MPEGVPAQGAGGRAGGLRGRRHGSGGWARQRCWQECRLLQDAVGNANASPTASSLQPAPCHIFLSHTHTLTRGATSEHHGDAVALVQRVVAREGGGGAGQGLPRHDDVVTAAGRARHIGAWRGMEGHAWQHACCTTLQSPCGRLLAVLPCASPRHALGCAAWIPPTMPCPRHAKQQAQQCNGPRGSGMRTVGRSWWRPAAPAGTRLCCGKPCPVGSAGGRGARGKTACKRRGVRARWRRGREPPWLEGFAAAMAAPRPPCRGSAVGMAQCEPHAEASHGAMPPYEPAAG